MIALGFRKKPLIEDIGGILVETLHHHYNWGSKREIHIASLDVETAFEQMEHQSIALALFARGIPAHYVAACMREIENHIIPLEVPTAGETDPTELTSGCIPGGVPTPFFFRCMTEASMEGAVSFLQRLQMRLAWYL